MSATWEYPGSRIQGNTRCDLCEKGNFFGNNNWIEMTNIDGETIKYLTQTCSYCGFVRFFDIEQARRTPYRGSEGIEEVFPKE